MGEWVYTPDGEGRLPIDRGMGVRHHDVNAAQKGASARLHRQPQAGTPGDWISLWVYEVEASFSVQGTNVQASKFREFYPHNFAQPTFTVRGQTANNFEYNRLSEFIRQTHRDAAFFDEHGFDSPTITLTIFGGGQDTVRGTKGSHSPLSLQGFIPFVPRGAKRFQFMHEFEFDFVVTFSNAGLMKDEVYTARKLLTWAEVFALDKRQQLDVATPKDPSTFETDASDYGVNAVVQHAEETDSGISANLPLPNYQGRH